MRYFKNTLIICGLSVAALSATTALSSSMEEAGQSSPARPQVITEEKSTGAATVLSDDNRSLLSVDVVRRRTVTTLPDGTVKTSPWSGEKRGRTLQNLGVSEYPMPRKGKSAGAVQKQRQQWRNANKHVRTTLKP